MSDLLTTYDAWLTDDGPAALVIREHLMPVEGRDGVVFPATFAAAEDKSKFSGGYNIDGPFNGQSDSANVCLIDSVGSQANRVELIFARGQYATLIPQITIKAGDRTVNIVEAGHRAGDAIVRCTELGKTINAAFKGVLKGNAHDLARIAPTSLVFGVWDSRDTQAKLPRIVCSTIRAFAVQRLTRGAQFVPVIDYVAEGVLDQPADKAAKDAYSQKGFTHVPSSAAHGGVIATGGIRRDATLNLAAIRLLNAGTAPNGTDHDPLPLRRYILGLSLVAFTHPSAFVGYLRQGCTLVLDPDAKPTPREFTVVHHDGTRDRAELTHDAALTFAQAAAKKFGVGESKSVEFDRKLAQDDLAEAKSNKKPGKGKKSAS
jgi:CRISPR-associated protein Csb1